MIRLLKEMNHSTLKEYAERISMVVCGTAVVVFFISKYMFNEFLQKDIGRKIQGFYKETKKQIRETVGNLGPVDHRIQDIQLLQNQSVVKTIQLILGFAMTVVLHRLVTDVIFPAEERSVVSAFCVGALLGILAGMILSLESGSIGDNSDQQPGGDIHIRVCQPPSSIEDNNEDIARGAEGNIPVNIGQQPSSNVDNNEDIARGAEGNIPVNIGQQPSSSVDNNEDTARGVADHDSVPSFQYDILVLHKSDDIAKADKLKKQLEDIIPDLNVILNNEFEDPGKIELLACSRYFKEARYIFVYGPETMYQEALTQYKLWMTQYDCIMNGENNGRLIPVRETENKNDTLRLVKPISYTDGKLKKNEIKKLIEDGRKSLK